MVKIHPKVYMYPSQIGKKTGHEGPHQFLGREGGHNKHGWWGGDRLGRHWVTNLVWGGKSSQRVFPSWVAIWGWVRSSWTRALKKARIYQNHRV